MLILITINYGSKHLMTVTPDIKQLLKSMIAVECEVLPAQSRCLLSCLVLDGSRRSFKISSLSSLSRFSHCDGDKIAE